MKTILDHKDWRTALRTSHPTLDRHGTIVPETPLRLLIKRYPDLAELVFNNCIIREEDKALRDDIMGSRELNSLTMDYEFIDDAFHIGPPAKDSKESFFSYCNINEHGELQPFRKAYNTNAKVIMDKYVKLEITVSLIKINYAIL